jgi:hypothetical protein
MVRKLVLRSLVLLGLGAVLCVGAGAQQAAPPAKVDHKAGKAAPQPAVSDFIPGLEPRAIEILKAASARLAAAKSMSFTAVVSYESPSRLGPPLVYSTKSQVTMKRPDKLRVLTLGDGPPSEFYYDGKVMMAFAPAENLVAVADAPPTIDRALQAAFDTAAIYFPFSDVIVADPYKDIADGLKHAFYIGKSTVVAGTTTDMVAYLTGNVFVQAWIGAEDRLPRRLYAIFLNDPLRLRHVLELSDWHLDVAVSPDAFGSPKAASAKHIAFAAPEGKSAGMQPPPKSQPSKTKSGATP